jgi:hypothetical protein
VFGRNRDQQLRQGIPVRGITRDNRHIGAKTGQLLDQFRCTGCLDAAPAGQQQVPNTVLGHQVTGEEPAKHSGPAGDQHRAVQLRRLTGSLRDPDQARRPDHVVTYGNLRLTGTHGQCNGGSGTVQEHDPVGVLGLGRAHQAPDRGTGQVGHVHAG